MLSSLRVRYFLGLEVLVILLTQSSLAVLSVLCSSFCVCVSVCLCVFLEKKDSIINKMVVKIRYSIEKEGKKTTRHQDDNEIIFKF